MIRYLIVTSLIFTSLLALADNGLCFDEKDNEYYQRERERNDFVQLQVLNDRVTAFRNQNSSTPAHLDVGEEVLAQKEDGDVGAVLTNNRFLAISTLSKSWLSKTLYAGESESARLLVGREIALLVSDQRIIGFSAKADRLIEYPLSVGDNIVASDVGQRVGVVVLPERAVGFSDESTAFSTIQFDYSGAFRSLEVAADVALVKTDNRIYAYRAAGGIWSAQDIPPNE